MLHLIEEFMECLTLEEFELFWTQVWIVWNQRNNLLHGGKMKISSSLNKKAEEYIEDFKCAQTQLNAQMRQ